MRWAMGFVGLATVTAQADRRVNLQDLSPPTEKAAYAPWLAGQAPAVRAAIAKNCADGYAWDPLCNGIGPYGLESPPPRDDVAARAAWDAQLSPEAAAWVARKCAGPKHLASELCGFALPTPPAAGVAYGAWFKGLTRNERAMVDEHCAEMPTGTDEYCDGIGPLHIPVPPDTTAAMMPGSGGPRVADVQAEWDAWYRKLSKKQKAYYRYWCTGERAAVSPLCGGTPLVVVFDGKPVAYTRATDGSRFAIDGVSALRTDWPTARTPWIARDVNGDGMITDGTELFGSGTDGGARDGFEALARLDDNGDGVLDARDRAWPSLLLWRDHDGDRRGVADELAPLSSAVEHISLEVKRGGRCDARGNCERLHASAGAATVVDVQLLTQPPRKHQ
jgi:hypothetical protein